MKKRRLLIYFSISLALITLLGVSFFYLRKLNALEHNSARVDHSYEVILQTNLLEKNLLNAETSQRSYLMTDNSEFLESYLAELKGIPDIILSLEQLTADNARQLRNLDTLKDVINKQVKLLKENMTGQVDTISIDRFRQSHVYMEKIEAVINTIKSSETYLLSERTINKAKNSAASRQSSFLSLIIAFALCCIASVSIILFFNRNEIYRTRLEDQVAQLTTLNSEVRQLAIASAHNLQEPMRKMQMIIDWLQHFQGLADPQLNEQLNRIKEIYGRQQLMNTKIIDYYAILLSTLNKTKIPLNSFLTALQQKQHWSGLQLKADALPTIYADARQLELLFNCLIDNAQQYRHPERAPELHIYALKPEEAAAALPGTNGMQYDAIVVSDNGIGLQETYYEKIFDLFQRVELQRDNTKQSGMGLSFCKRILLNHGGRIAARKNSPHGLSILLFFPKK